MPRQSHPQEPNRDPGQPGPRPDSSDKASPLEFPKMRVLTTGWTYRETRKTAQEVAEMIRKGEGRGKP